ncbi:MAG: hypothetical protein O7D88_04350, partial [Gammaproteobacteria bacterium]|nr:hypothetical protein [Gammaproteobacteria bacterium]
MPRTSELQQTDPVRGQKYGSVPCIDARELAGNDAAVIATIRDACLNTGFFFLDHAFGSEKTIGRVLGQMHAFFALDDA